MTEHPPSVPSDPDSWQPLPCGAAIDELLEQVAQGHADDQTTHQRDCPHCQATLAELDRRWAPVRAYATSQLPAPPTLLDAVMRGVRQIARDTWYTLELTDGGSLRIATRVVARYAREAAERVPGVRAALGRSTESTMARLVERSTRRHRHPHAAVGVLGRTAVVELALAVDYGPPLHDIARQVQHDVITELRRTIGLQAVTVNVTIDDITIPTALTRGEHSRHAQRGAEPTRAE